MVRSRHRPPTAQCALLQANEIRFNLPIFVHTLTYCPLATPCVGEDKIMFSSLEEQMKHDDAIATSPRQRMTKWAVIAVVAVAVFGALYYAIQAFA
jgi:hypothetical protein